LLELKNEGRQKNNFAKRFTSTNDKVFFEDFYTKKEKRESPSSI